MALRLKLALVFAILTFGISCGPNSENKEAACGANVVDSGLQLSVEHLGGNVYEMRLCAPANPASVYSVYGAPIAVDLEPENINVNGAIRKRQITSANETGDAFQVEFKGSDRYFAIYRDKSLAGGLYALDSSQTMVAPHLIPER